MTDKEKMKEFENWIKEQLKESDESYKKADEHGNRTRAYIEAITEAVLLKVLNKFNEIERR